ncbi:MAG: hypothetical protein KF901_07360 [Myxococcales bacterium]|nr:hypothetical protein [Myxococcales bacterium]
MSCLRCTMTPGTVREGRDNPIVTIEAGNVEIRGGGFFARYLVDRATHTCWLIAYRSQSPMECCDARWVPAVAAFVTRENDATCARRFAR